MTAFRVVRPRMPELAASTTAMPLAGSVSGMTLAGTGTAAFVAICPNITAGASSSPRNLTMRLFYPACASTATALRSRRAAITVGALKISAAQSIAAALLVFLLAGCRKSSPPDREAYVPKPKGTVIFNKDIAPIVFSNCSGCHHPGESAPFSLLTFNDVAKRAKQIVEVTQRRYMPPWLPDPDVSHFMGERRLSVEQLGLIKQWAEEEIGRAHV